MSSTFSHSLLRMVVAKICQDVGWHATHVSPLNVLCDLLAFYMRQLSIAAVDYANHGGRTQPNLDDLAMAFDYLNIDMSQMQDFVLNVDSSPLSIELPFFPISCKQNRVLDNCPTEEDEERPEFYYPWLPTLNVNKSLHNSNESNDQNNLKTEICLVDENKIENLEEKNSETNKTSKSIKNNDTGEEDDEVFIDELKINENVETKDVHEEEQKKKLVFKFSLGKSTDENNSAVQDASQNRLNIDSKSELNQMATSEAITSHLMSSRAFLKLVQSSLYQNPEDSESKKLLRLPDSKRLPNNHKSRENSPEPDVSNSPSLLSLGLNSLHEPLKCSNQDFDGKIKKNKRSKNKENNMEQDEHNFSNRFGDTVKPNIKVKDIGLKGKKFRDTNKKPRVKKSKEAPVSKMLSIKVTGFGLKNKSEDPFDFSQSSEKLDLENLKSSDPPPKQKRQYKKREKPKDYVENRGRKPKNLTGEKTLKKASSSALEKNKTNLEDGELPPSPISSFSSVSSPLSRSFSPNFKSSKKHKSGDTFGDNEAARTLVLISESNDTNHTFKDDDSHTTMVKVSGDGDNSDSSDNDSAMDFSDTTNQSKPTPKKVGRPSTKRIKGVHQKKVVKSAEVVESSDDSSSDDNQNADQHLISLLPPPPEVSLKTTLDASNNPATNSSQSGRKRRLSNISISSLSSIDSCKSPLELSEERTKNDGEFPPKEEKHSKSSSIESLENNDSKSRSSFSEKTKETSGKKHKKDKRHSKVKHRSSTEVEKSHKKHKKLKEKDLKLKSKDKPIVKPKLSIKLNLDVKKHDDDLLKHSTDSNQSFSESLKAPVKEAEKEEQISVVPKLKTQTKIDQISTTQLSVSNKKKRGPKNKKGVSETPGNELVFIKNTSSFRSSSKESKNKNPIINLSSSLFDDASDFDKITKNSSSSGVGSSKQKSKDIKAEKIDSTFSSGLENLKKENKTEEKKEIKTKHTKEIVNPVLEPVMAKPKKEKLIKEEKREKIDNTASVSKSKFENSSCIVIRETINVDQNIEDNVYICPTCKLPDDGSSMICCDECEAWHHWVCVGIFEEPSPEEKWFCSKCVSKKSKKNQKKKNDRLKSSVTDGASRSSVTITPILAPPPIVTSLSSEVSLIPINSPLGYPSTASSSVNKQPNITITPTGAAYKPTGRPRGRPRKDSSSTPVLKKHAQPSISISSIGSTSSMGQAFDPFAIAQDADFMINRQFGNITSSGAAFDPSHQASPLSQYSPVGPSKPAKRSKDICPQCQISNLDVNMIGCDSCDQWYHWPCVGINNAPSPDSNWLCSKCRKKKSTKRLWNDSRDSEASGEDEAVSLTDAKFLAATSSLSSSKSAGGISKSNRRFMSPVRRMTQELLETNISDAATASMHDSQDQQWRCGTCQLMSTSDDNTFWIACDECNQWYHFSCEGITETPSSDESWFCKKCIQRQKTIASKIAKIKRI